ncbi:type II toxin-antitoxin system RelE/ParE family toxin [Singulisphaera sp. Ch08]|uniref:Type II toxin-antitoxin system RelE/ParE family toxin n=1 Tax=Singulisphaera sp. Ch08 TaxID=3120278 RepID=A0AAU7C902_9BACT
MKDAIVLKSPQARLDLIGCYVYIGERNQSAAHRFLKAAEATFATLARTPQIGELYEVDNDRLAGLRCAFVKRFRNYLIFYRPIDGGIDVIRVLHATRNFGDILRETN